MKSVSDFNEEQIMYFKGLADDVVGPTCTVYALTTIESIVSYIADDLDDLDIPEGIRDQIDVCLSVLEYFRMYSEIMEKDKNGR